MGQIRQLLDIETSAAMLVCVLQRIATHTIFDAKNWPAMRQSHALAEAIRALQ